MSTTRSIPTQETTTDKPPPDEFHPGKCLPDCMMPDGGECCPGCVALYDAYWHLMRSARAQRALDMPLARSIAHKHCTCTCRDDPKVMQNHTNLCDHITKAISEYTTSAVTSTDGAAK